MANRHAHKKLRAEIRARMVKTGESYQAARNRIVSRVVRHANAVDLIPFKRFGVPMTLATFEGEMVHSFAVLGQAPRLADLTLQSFLVPTMRFLRPRGVN